MLKEVESVKEEVNKQLKPALLKDSVSYKQEGSPPQRNCTHPWNRNLGCVFFFLQDSFGLMMPYKKPDIEPSTNWKYLDRDNSGRFHKKEK